MPLSYFVTNPSPTQSQARFPFNGNDFDLQKYIFANSDNTKLVLYYANFLV